MDEVSLDEVGLDEVSLDDVGVDPFLSNKKQRKIEEKP
jgi:hypothetical protein